MEANEKKWSPKLIVTLVVIIIVVLTIIFIIIYKAGKKKGGINISKVPTDAGTGSGTPSLSNSEIDSLALALYTDMDGVNWKGHDTEAWNKTNSLSDTDIVRLYNAFNTKYQKDSGQTFTEWIANEKSVNLLGPLGGGNIFGGDDVFSSDKESITERLTRLHLV